MEWSLGPPQERVLPHFSAVLPDLAMGEEVRSAAYELARRARVRGVTVPATDLVIAACARVHGADLESADSDFQ